MNFRVEVNPRLCAGTSNCVEDAPGVFEVEGSGPARWVAPDASLESLLRGAEACPMQAIQIFEMPGGRRIFP